MMEKGGNGVKSTKSPGRCWTFSSLAQKVPGGVVGEMWSEEIGFRGKGGD